MAAPAAFGKLLLGSSRIDGGARRGAQWHTGVVGRGEPELVREHEGSAPRGITVQRISSERMAVEGERAA